MNKTAKRLIGGLIGVIGVYVISDIVIAHKYIKKLDEIDDKTEEESKEAEVLIKKESDRKIAEMNKEHEKRMKELEEKHQANMKLIDEMNERSKERFDNAKSIDEFLEACKEDDKDFNETFKAVFNAQHHETSGKKLLNNLNNAIK